MQNRKKKKKENKRLGNYVYQIPQRVSHHNGERAPSNCKGKYQHNTLVATPQCRQLPHGDHKWQVLLSPLDSSGPWLAREKPGLESLSQILCWKSRHHFHTPWPTRDMPLAQEYPGISLQTLLPMDPNLSSSTHIQQPTPVGTTANQGPGWAMHACVHRFAPINPLNTHPVAEAQTPWLLSGPSAVPWMSPFQQEHNSVLYRKAG